MSTSVQVVMKVIACPEMACTMLTICCVSNRSCGELNTARDHVGGVPRILPVGLFIFERLILVENAAVESLHVLTEDEVVPIVEVLLIKIIRTELLLADHVADKPAVRVGLHIALPRLHHIQGDVVRGFRKAGIASDDRRAQLRPGDHVALIRLIARIAVLKLEAVGIRHLAARREIGAAERARDLRERVVRALDIVRHLGGEVPVPDDRVERPRGDDREDRKDQHGQHQLDNRERPPHRFFLQRVITVVSLRSLLRRVCPQRITVRTVYRKPLRSSSSSSTSSTVRSNV